MEETHTFRDDLSQPGKLRAIRIIFDNLCSLTKQQMVSNGLKYHTFTFS